MSKHLPLVCELCNRRPVAHKAFDGNTGVERELCARCFRIWMGLVNAQEGVQFTFHGELPDLLALFAPVHAGVVSQLNALKSQMERLLMASQAVLAFSQRIDAATSKIGADIQVLLDKIAAGGELSPDDIALLEGSVAKLEAMGKDPDNPVPAEPVPPVA